MGALMRRPRPKHRKKTLAESNLGRNARIFENGDILQFLRAAVEQEGSKAAFAARHGLTRTDLSKILHGRRPVSSTLAKALGLRKVYVVDRR